MGVNQPQQPHTLHTAQVQQQELVLAFLIFPCQPEVAVFVLAFGQHIESLVFVGPTVFHLPNYARRLATWRCSNLHHLKTVYSHLSKLATRPSQIGTGQKSRLVLGSVV